MRYYTRLVPLCSHFRNAVIYSFLIFVHQHGYGQDFSFNDSIARLNINIPPRQIIKSTSITQLHFIKEPYGRFDIGLVGDAYYCFILKLDSKNEATQEKCLSIDNTSLDT